ncbi:MAG TPA: hypothetical protein HPP80_00910 [Rhodospirillaceae bacterium]|nr:hypothetical protein [Rhodospirillaceae bacterium]
MVSRLKGLFASLAIDIQHLRKNWVERKRYAISEMPTLMLCLLGSGSFLVSGYYGLVESKTLFDTVAITNSVALYQIGLLGALLWVLHAMMGFKIWFFGNLAWKCNAVLRDRMFP